MTDSLELSTLTQYTAVISVLWDRGWGSLAGSLEPLRDGDDGICQPDLQTLLTFTRGNDPSPALLFACEDSVHGWFGLEASPPAYYR